MVVETEQIPRLAGELDQQHPAYILGLALREYPGRIALSFSGAEDVVLLDMAIRAGLPLRVFTLDTGRLHPQTYRFLDTVRERYGVLIETYYPQPIALQELVSRKGFYSFYVDGHEECCAIRKVEPLTRAVAGLDAYVTGQRKDQSPTRQSLPVVQVDHSFSSADRALIKFNPLANWTSAMVWTYIRENDVPFNPLHDVGYRSIGCEPCTRPTRPDEHERAGRWWWEEATRRECGLHVINHVDMIEKSNAVES